MGKFDDFVRNTSLHGFKYLSTDNDAIWKKFFRRIFWCGFILFSITQMCSVLTSSWNEFSSLATSINLDVNYRDWNNTFPAVSLCLMKGRSTDGIRDFMLNYWNATNVKTPNRPIRHYRNVQNLLFMNFYQPLDGIDIGRCLELNETCGVNVEVIKRELFPKSCKEFMPIVKFLGREIDCDSIFKPQRSELGDCFTANSLYSNGDSLDNFEQLPMKFSNQEYVERSLEIHYHDNELMIYKIFVHSPDELPDATTEGFNLRKYGSHTYMAIRIVEIINQKDVKNESIANRACRFPDELITRNSQYQPPYSLSSCRAAARVTRELNSCNCTLPVGIGPKFLQKEGNVCNIIQFKCIQESFEEFVQTVGDDHCSIPTCSAMDIGLVGKVYTIIDETKSVVVIEVINKPSYRYIRRVVVTKLDMIVQFGGIVGLFIGASIISIVEIVFFVYKMIAEFFMRF